MIKIVMTASEINPPVVELYYVYPLYLTNLAVGNRSINLKALLAVERIGIISKNLNL